MSGAKAVVIDKVNSLSDELDELQIIERLYMLARLEHSIKRVEKEGSISEDALVEHFRKKREALADA